MPPPCCVAALLATGFGWLGRRWFGLRQNQQCGALRHLDWRRTNSNIEAANGGRKVGEDDLRVIAGSGDKTVVRDYHGNVSFWFGDRVAEPLVIPDGGYFIAE